MKSIWKRALSCLALVGAPSIALGDVVPPSDVNPATFLQNAPFSSELETELITYGYEPGASCIQEKLRPLTPGRLTRVYELHSASCEDYGLVSLPLATLRTRRDASPSSPANEMWLQIIELNGEPLTLPQPVGRLQETEHGPVINSLCQSHFGSVCDLILRSDGSIGQLKIN